MITSKKPLSQQKLHKTQRNLTNKLNLECSCKKVIEYLDQFKGYERYWRVTVINYLGWMSNKYSTVCPSQDRIAQGLVTRESVNKFLKELHELGFLHKYRRRIPGNKTERTCVYVLGDWARDPYTREKYKHIFRFMREVSFSIFFSCWDLLKDPNKWDHFTDSINKNIDMRRSQHFVTEIVSTRPVKPPGIAQRHVFSTILDGYFG